MGNQAEGVSSIAMQQGGIGLLLSILIIPVPPMAAMLFQGTPGSFSPYSVFGGWAAASGRPTANGQLAGSPGSGVSPSEVAGDDTDRNIKSGGAFGEVRAHQPIQPTKDNQVRSAPQRD